ncbi:MAG: response regulator [Candidatus Brocadia sp.]|jgi:DNA-binding NtrC family response regulator
MSRILIIEEQEKARRSLVGVFKREGFATCDGTGWDNAPELFGRNAYDLIVVDLSVEHSNGYEMLKAFRFSNPDAEIVAIVSPGMYDADRMSRCRVYDYILKPFRQKEVIDIGKKALEKKQLADRVRNLEQIMDMKK